MKLIKNKKERELMFIVGQKLAKVFNEILFENIINKTKIEVDYLIKNLLDNYGLTSTCKGYRGYSGYSCISINNQLVHGVPTNQLIKESDLVKIDICASFNGYCADAARPYGFFESNEIFLKMKQCGQLALNAGISAIKPGVRIGTISSAIETVIVNSGFSVVRDFAGHGIGRNMHEDPEVPNYGVPNTGQKLYVGMALAIEPMFCQYKSDLIIDKKDGWTAYTEDNGIAMHIEDTVILDESEVIVSTRLE